jgi:16S rRNA (guanine966-N2)-methyltransferase
MLSRGAASALLVERERRALGTLRRSVKELELTGRARVLAMDLSRPPPSVARRLEPPSPAGFHLVLADPPYDAVDLVPPLVRTLAGQGKLAPGALIALEHAARHPPRSWEGLASTREYRYGDTAIVLAEAERS